MRIALLTTFAASRKEPLAIVMDRVRQAFLDAGLGEPLVRFNFGDAVVGGFVSSVDRVLKRHPELERFVTSGSPVPGFPGARRISNGPMSPGAGEDVPYATLQTIAAGVPRSFPFHSVAIQFYSPEFGDLEAPAIRSAQMMTGVLLADSWWVNGRNRSLSACTVVEAEAGRKKLPAPAGAVAAVLAACGKVKRTVQSPLPSEVASANPEASLAVKAIVSDYRARRAEIVARASMPHELPQPGSEALREVALGVTAGPKKPVLESLFKPMGYTCQGASGTFTLRRRTASNLTVELYLDVGTWGHQVLAIFRVFGLGFKATLPIPVSATALATSQYPIGDAVRWRKIVENLAAMVAELDRSLVPDIEAAAGPSPEWYLPES
jgi:hypothetical protein